MAVAVLRRGKTMITVNYYMDYLMDCAWFILILQTCMIER